MNEAQSAPSNLQILSKIKQAPSNHLWCLQLIEDSGTHRGGRDHHGEPASVQPWGRDGASLAWWCQFLGASWVVIILQGQPATALLTQPAKQTSEIILCLPLYLFESSLYLSEDRSVFWVTFCVRYLTANAQVWPQSPPHTIYPILICLYFISIFMYVFHQTYFSLVLL